MDFHLPADQFLLTGALLLIGGLVASRLATRVRVPGMILFLLAGMALGDGGLRWLELSNTRVAQTAAVAALVMILFDGGLANSMKEIRRILAPAAALATIGVAITAGIVGLAAMRLFHLSTTNGMLIGAVVASTDAAAVFGVLRGAALPRRLADLLETESGANDPMAALLTVGFLSMWSGGGSATDWIVFGLRQLVGGLLIGWAMGWLAGRAMNHREWVDGSIVPIVGLATAAAAYGFSGAVGASGFLAVYVSAIVVVSQAPSYQRPLNAFFDSIAEISQFGLFFLLGVLVLPSALGSVALKSIVIAAVLVFIARPVAVLLCLAAFNYRPRELAFISLAGLRGAVPIVLATFPLTSGHPNGALIFNVTFFVVLISAALQGTAIRPAIKWLGLSEPKPAWEPITAIVPIGHLGMQVVEIRLRDESPLIGVSLHDAPPPDNSRVITMVRSGTVHLPHGATTFQSGDFLSVAIADSDVASDDLTKWARGPQ